MKPAKPSTQCKSPGRELFVPEAQMCHQHEQDQSESANVDRMNTTAPQSWRNYAAASWTSSRRKRHQYRPTDAVAMRQHQTSQKTGRSECRLHNSEDGDHVASPAAAGQQRKGGRELVRGLNPAALQITLLTIPTGTPLSGCTVQ